MKKQITVLIITIIIALNLSAQKGVHYIAHVAKYNPSTIHAVSTFPKDTTAPKTIPDTTANICLSVSDINRYLQPLGDQIPYNKYQEILQVLSYMVATKQKELQTNSKKK